MSRKPLGRRSYVFDAEAVPRWLPGFARRVLVDLVYDEAHAALLGLVGALAGPAWLAGLGFEAGAVGMGLVVSAFGLRRAEPGGRVPLSRRVLRREPWYFTTVLVATAVVSLLAAAGWSA